MKHDSWQHNSRRRGRHWLMVLSCRTLRAQGQPGPQVADLKGKIVATNAMRINTSI
jgi:hypothetical protein